MNNIILFLRLLPKKFWFLWNLSAIYQDDISIYHSMAKNNAHFMEILNERLSGNDIKADKVVAIFAKDVDSGLNFALSLVRTSDIVACNYPQFTVKDGRTFKILSPPFGDGCGVRYNKIYISTSFYDDEIVYTVMRPFIASPFDSEPEVWFDENTGKIQPFPTNERNIS